MVVPIFISTQYKEAKDLDGVSAADDYVEADMVEMAEVDGHPEPRARYVYFATYWVLPTLY